MQFKKKVLNLDPVLETDRILRFLQQHVETPVARKMIAGEFAAGATVKVEVKDGALVIS